MLRRIGRAGVLAVTLAMIAGIATTLAHETREVGEYRITVGFISEPVFTGQKSGLEFRVLRGEEPVEGLADTLEAQAIFGDQTRDLPLTARFGQPGWYQSVFFPTAAGPYTFHIRGEIEGIPFDERFTSGEDTFHEVQEVTAGQFPVVLPAAGDTARDAQAGAEAATTATIALVLGAGGLVAGLVAIGLTLARRRA
jgi:lipid-binding SYLF domain-containing protein